MSMQKKLGKLKVKILLFEQKLADYKELFEADGVIDKKEQRKLDKLATQIKKIQQNISKREAKLLAKGSNTSSTLETPDPNTMTASIDGAIASTTSPSPQDDPIKKNLAYWIDMNAETFVNIQGWHLGNKNQILDEKIELDSENILKKDLPANAFYHVNIWSKTLLERWQGVFANVHTTEYIIKEFSYEITITASGKFSYSSIENKIVETKETQGGLAVIGVTEYNVKLAANHDESNQTIKVTSSALLPRKEKDKDKEEKVQTQIQVGIKFITTNIEKENPIKDTKELVFENENQAILSSDQTKHLQQWWDQLNSELQTKVKNREAKIEITGYTSETGTHDYNLKLGEERAFDTGKKLATIIGKDLDSGKSIAEIIPISKGEESNEPQRYVKIIIIQK
jgi:outer membrane protein OmpA-like peptidoglycan-associated protein